MLNNWSDWVTTFTGVVASSVLALPVAVLAVVVLALSHRRRGRPTPWRMALAEVGIVYGTVPWVWLILLRGSGGSVNLVPLRDLRDIVAAGEPSQIVGNLIVFAALGFFGPIRFAALASVRRVLALAASLSVLVEVLQYVLMLDRVSSVDDVLLNTAGAGLAALLSRHWWRTSSTAGVVSWWCHSTSSGGTTSSTASSPKIIGCGAPACDIDTSRASPPTNTVAETNRITSGSVRLTSSSTPSAIHDTAKNR